MIRFVPADLHETMGEMNVYACYLAWYLSGTMVPTVGFSDLDVCLMLSAPVVWC